MCERSRHLDRAPVSAPVPRSEGPLLASLAAGGSSTVMDDNEEVVCS